MNPNTLPEVREHQEPEPEPASPRGLTAGRVTAIFVALFVAGIAIRLWRLGISPAWQYDEAVYWRVSENMQHHALAEHSVYGQPFQPFLYQPPMFFEIESRWFDLVGASIYHARLFGVICTGVMQVLLVRLLIRLHGLRIALLAVLPVIFDGWLLYIERVSYIENALMILVVLGFLLYARALEAPSLWRFFIAGLALGAAASFKQTGAYVIVAVLFCWLIVRRPGRGHLVLLGGALLVIAAYISLMIVKYDRPGDPWFIHQSLVQIRRVLGLRQSGGTLTSLSGALHLLTQQYKYFVPSLVLAGCAIGVALRRTWQCYRARSWAAVQSNAVLYAWMLAGVVVFGVSSLKFPQYFVLILLPAYCYFWTELAHWDLDPWWRAFWPIAAATVGTMSFLLTVPAFNVNSLAEVQTYAADRIPASAIVVTEETIGDLINQRWCTVENATACRGHATYAITWQTYLQSSFTEGGAAFHKLMKGATAITSFSGAAGTATVWKLSSKVPVALPTASLGSNGPVVGVNLYALTNYTAAQTKAYGERTLPYIKNTLHASAVDLVWNMYAPSYYSNSVVTSKSKTLTAANIGILTKIAQGEGLYVEYRPLLFVQTTANTWEGLLEPTDRTKWFNSYYAQNLPYLKMAQQYRINEYVIGTEMKRLSPAKQWKSFLAKSAKIFRGQISYAQNQYVYFPPHTDLPPTMLTGVDMYEPLPLSPGASLSEVEAAYDKFFAETPASILRRSAIQETGIQARAGAYLVPPNLTLSGTLDPTIQYNWFTAGCEAVKRFHLRAIFFWKVDLADNPAHPATSLSTWEGRIGAAAISNCASIIKG